MRIKEKTLRIFRFAGFCAVLGFLKILLSFRFKPSAEKEGFEPPDLLQSTVFKTAAFDRSAISPVCRSRYLIAGAKLKCFFDCENFFETIYK